MGEVDVSEIPKINFPELKSLRVLKEEEECKIAEEDKEGGISKEEEEEEEEREVVSETGAKLPPRDKKFSEVEVFRFGIDARQADILVLRMIKVRKM
jgi:hypothetical protein